MWKSQLQEHMRRARAWVHEVVEVELLDVLSVRIAEEAPPFSNLLEIINSWFSVCKMCVKSPQADYILNFSSSSFLAYPTEPYNFRNQWKNLKKLIKTL